MQTNIKIKYSLNRSHFIGFTEMCRDNNGINEIVKSYKKKYKDAKQICYAILLNNTEIYNDDKEPNGTAGYMILNELKKNNIQNYLIIIVRYFGGIKLGKNNLRNTYAYVADLVIKEIKQIEIGKTLI